MESPFTSTSLGGHFTATADKNGLVRLEGNEMEGVEMSDSQSRFYAVVSEATSMATGLSKFNVVNHDDKISQSVYVGDNGAYSESASPGNHIIDVGDVKALGQGKLTEQGALAHEIVEGRVIQTSGNNNPEAAHQRGITAESRVTGTLVLGRGGELSNDRSFQADLPTHRRAASDA